MIRIPAESGGTGPDGKETFRPLLTVTLSVKKSALYQAVVDSGADFSMVSADLVEPLGAKWDRMTDPVISLGAGGPFETRFCRGQIYYGGVLIANGFRVAHEIKINGQTVSLFLLGRADFFSKFVPTFHWEDDAPWFDLEPVVSP